MNWCKLKLLFGPSKKKIKEGVLCDAFRKGVVERENFAEGFWHNAASLCMFTNWEIFPTEGGEGSPNSGFFIVDQKFSFASPLTKTFLRHLETTLWKLWDNFDYTDYWRSVHLPRGQHMAIFFLYSLKCQFDDCSFRHNVLACCCC